MRKVSYFLFFFLILPANYIFAEVFGKEARHPEISNFLTMPFEEVIIGIAASFDAGRQKIPALKSGEIAVFSRGSAGKVQRLATGNPVEITIKQPQFTIQTEDFLAKKRIRLNVEKKMFSEFRDSGGIDVEKVDISMNIVSASSGIVSRQNISLIQEKSAKGGVVSSKVEQRQMLHTDSGGMESKAELKKSSAKQSSAGQKSANVNKDTSAVAGTAGEKSVLEEKQMQMVAAGNNMLSRLTTLLAEKASNAGKLSTIEEYYDLLAKYGEKLIVALIEKGTALLGIFEEGVTEALEERSYVPVIDEINNFNSLLKSNSDLAELVHRPFSRSFADPHYNDRLADATIATSYRVLPNLLYHGAMSAVMVSIKNNSEIPIYDMLIAMAVPEHTTFARFLEAAPFDKGYLNTFMAAEQMMVTKVYRPIMPGQTFNNIALLKIDPWNYTAPE